MNAILCVGPGPHAPADGILGEAEEGEQVPRAVCAACAEHPLSLPAPPPSDVPTVPAVDVAALAAEIDSQRARLDAAEDALNFLIIDSLGGE